MSPILRSVISIAITSKVIKVKPLLLQVVVKKFNTIGPDESGLLLRLIPLKEEETLFKDQQN
jgi:hypothetical protein